jgi:hypothetical protein
MQVSGQPYPQYPLDGGLDRPETCSGHCSREKFLALTRKWTLTFQPIAHHYTDWAIPAPPLDLVETVFPPTFISNTSEVAQCRRTLSRFPYSEKTAKNTNSNWSIPLHYTEEKQLFVWVKQELYILWHGDSLLSNDHEISRNHVCTTTIGNSNIGMAFSVQSMPRCYKEGKS